eukprot:TRINITY_DN5613_c0_g1_i1.p1 TRINITY_DN5613_c0_g1~~TRINITY_DN5613_c0_g1_i1.p1  ORF type:complete len:332 (+),score=102.98 TRINITY_DN5613_c0_g1_i1:121-1116(+)
MGLLQRTFLAASAIVLHCACCSQAFIARPSAVLSTHISPASSLKHSRQSSSGSSSRTRSSQLHMSLGGGRPPYPTKVAFQGEPGAYSEKCLREMLGQDVIAVGRPSFEDVFRSVSNREADYAVIPIENSLGGSIHANYDLLLRFELFIIGEHDFKVEHSLMALPGTKASEIKQVLSHQQALAQCDNYLRAMPGVERVPTYDTAGSAKMIAEKGMKGCAAIASELAAETYGLEVLATNIEDDHVNFTRFLLLARQPVGVFIAPPVPAKTSVVFTLPNTAGALYKALACFSLRDIDFSKIESRPTSAQLLQYLRYQLLPRRARPPRRRRGRAA